METNNHRPDSIKLSSVLMVVFPIVSIVYARIYPTPQQLNLMQGSRFWMMQCMAVLLNVFLSWGIYRGKNWSRIIYTMFGVIGCLLNPLMMRYLPDRLPVAAGVLGILLTIVILFLLYRPESSAWFNQNTTQKNRSLFKQILLVTSIFLGLVGIFAGLAAYRAYDIMKHKDRLVIESKLALENGAQFGKAHSGKECFDAAIQELKTTFARSPLPNFIAKYYLESCLDASKARNDLCSLAPSSYNITTVVTWGMDMAQRYQIDPHNMQGFADVFEKNCKGNTP